VCLLNSLDLGLTVYLNSSRCPGSGRTWSRVFSPARPSPLCGSPAGTLSSPVGVIPKQHIGTLLRSHGHAVKRPTNKALALALSTKHLSTPEPPRSSLSLWRSQDCEGQIPMCTTDYVCTTAMPYIWTSPSAAPPSSSNTNVSTPNDYPLPLDPARAKGTPRRCGTGVG